MNYGEGGLSASDVALLSGRNTGNDGFGESSGWWIIVFLIFALGGWGRNGNNGFGGGNSGGVGENYVLATDFATIERKLDTIANGICDSTFALNNTATNGFAATQQTLCQGFSGINQAITANGYETRLGVNNLAAQLASCCCDVRQQISDSSCATQRAIDGVNYNMAMNTNVLQQTLCNNTRDIIENQNANYRAIHEELVANKLEAKNDRIAEQQSEINALRLAASQERQNAYLLNELKPCPSAAYIVPNPNCCYNYNVTGFGYANSGCNCGNC